MFRRTCRRWEISHGRWQLVWIQASIPSAHALYRAQIGAAAAALGDAVATDGAAEEEDTAALLKIRPSASQRHLLQRKYMQLRETNTCSHIHVRARARATHTHTHTHTHTQRERERERERLCILGGAGTCVIAPSHKLPLLPAGPR